KSGAYSKFIARGKRIQETLSLKGGHSEAKCQGLRLIWVFGTHRYHALATRLPPLCHGLPDVREEVAYRSDVISVILLPSLGDAMACHWPTSSLAARIHCRPTHASNSA